MKWTVTYRPFARDELADLWLNAPDRQAVAHAADAIDRILSRDPLNAGESRGGRRRLLIEPPLAVHYSTYPDDCKVVVWHVVEWN